MKNKYFLVSKNILKNLGRDTCQRIFIMGCNNKVCEGNDLHLCIIFERMGT